MTKPGRNDPCPCGSGRKFKRCCLPREASREAFERALHDDALPVLRDLARFATERAETTAEEIAAQHFPFWQPPLDRARTARLIEHLIFDHRPRGARQAILEFLIARGPLLDARRRELVEAWQDRAMRLYAFEGWSGGFARCRTVLPDESAVLEVMPLEVSPSGLSPGRPIALRALPVGAAYVYPSWPVTFGERSVDEIAAAVVARHHDYVRRERIASLGDFLALDGVVFDTEAAAGTRSQIIVPGRA